MSLVEEAFRRIFPNPELKVIAKARRLNQQTIKEAVLWEYGLEDLLPYVKDISDVEKNAQEFIKTQGTVASIRMALRWVGFPSITFRRLTSSEYEVGLGRIPTETEVEASLQAIAKAAPARGKLKRIFHEAWEINFG